MNLPDYMYYIDCACAHDIFRQFSNLNLAKEYYNKLDCEQKILYTDKGDHFETILKSEK